ncbi:phosphoribosyltransferase [Salinicola aestuarinus]|uniref:phosphoribosyltransferase n=1 Tax=Salinicola aestuarinus TaxID=1949082 RepID=UPI00130019B7|nr:phosphoribosyltransferase [Salinicola aestuarinus]
MSILLTSPSALKIGSTISDDLVSTLVHYSKRLPVHIVSNKDEPDWFSECFEGTKVTFVKAVGRQNGDVIKQAADYYQIDVQNVLVLSSSPEDVQMSKNGGAVMIMAGWSRDPKISKWGIKVDSPQDLSTIVDLAVEWSGDWWYTSPDGDYAIYALANLSGKGVDESQQRFAGDLTRLVKQGGAQLNALLTVMARSCLSEFSSLDDQLWGVYPSSNSTNKDQEVLSEFVHRLRTTVSRKRLASQGNPLFIRHSQSSKRSYGQGGSRIDPKEQIETLHINPFYRGKVSNKDVIVVDDCATYGLSFGVASAFLKAAGAKTVSCVALGKIGNCLKEYDITINSDPFLPVSARGYSYKRHWNCVGVSHGESNEFLRGFF